MANTILAALKNGPLGATAGIALSTDSGSTWSQAYTYGTADMVGLCSTPSALFAISNDGHLHTSVNGGVTWVDLGLIDATATTCADIGYIGNSTLVVANGAGANSAFISYNLGSSWSVLLTAPDEANRVLDLGGGTAIILGSNYSTTTGFEYRTTNYGAGWSTVSIGTFVGVDAADVGGGIVIATGAEDPYGSLNNQVKRSTDYGATWSVVYNKGSGWWGNTIGALPGTAYGFVTVSALTGPFIVTRELRRSADSGASWGTNMGDAHEMTLDGGSGSVLYGGRFDGPCPGAVMYAISISTDLGVSFADTTGYAPSRYIEISGASPPVADFEGSPTGGCWPLGVTFMDLSTNSPTGWAWSFGDGSPTGTDQNPYHTYTGVGSYTVELTATNSSGSDTETKPDYIIVSQVADFSGYPLTGIEPLGVTFTDLSLSSPTGWAWDFGDGYTGANQNPYHAYSSAGLYTVSLVALYTGGSYTETKADYVEVSPDTPVANFTMNKTSGYTPLSVHFSDTSTSISPIVSWLWTFGDGNTSTSQNPAHVYTAPGVYTITLTATNAMLRSDTEIKSRVLTVVLSTPSLRTHDEAPPQGDELLSHMVDTGSASYNIYGVGIRYYISSDKISPDRSGFKRPAGPSLIFD